ncbi:MULTISPECIES: OmpP1/FadL family transporter [Pseudomonadati]|uniref:Outer membrane protein transport protein n=1 Tax=Shewanella aestuarii TaxID=1028752 RepID=A0ABT0KYC9_9GAMM|nr:outer membrane protein transport protein [Shewanella aestuarii]MCL1116432.1 outer membrane protein transport protein [Shewanella aestuarii]GGN82024.1 long-chain fatty acid transporter [Shewanella aestuarii]
MKSSLLTLSPLALLVCLPVSASGLFLQEAVYANQGAAGAGDGVYTGSAASIWVNPAVMSFMEGNKTTVNGLVLDLGVDYYDQDNPSVRNGNSQDYIGSAAMFHVQQLTDDLHLGLSVATAGGSGLDYSANWAGDLQLENINLLTLQFNPSLSYKINDQWSVAVGAQINFASMDARMVKSDLSSESDWALGYNAGVVYQPSEQLTLGLSYRSKVEHDFNGDIDSDLGARLPPDGTYITLDRYQMDTSLVAIADFSARYQVNAQWAVMSTIQWHQWSDWDSTPMSFDGTVSGNNKSADLTQARNWDDVWHYGIGAEYAITPDWTLKAGVSYETSPQDDPSMQTPDIPVGSQLRYSVGASTMIGESKLDMFYEYADLGRVDISQQGFELGLANDHLLNGYFEGRMHFVGFALTF